MEFRLKALDKEEHPWAAVIVAKTRQCDKKLEVRWKTDIYWKSYNEKQKHTRSRS